MTGQAVAEIATVSAIADDVLAATGAERTFRRSTCRNRIVRFRHEVRQVQASVRLADAFAKLGGGSLLAATVLLVANGQAASSVVVTACVALLLFGAATIILIRVDRPIADLDLSSEIDDSALRETER